MSVQLKTVIAKPSKAFFIDMITRDLTVTDCILDLVDNSVDKAIETAQIDAMKMLVGSSRAAQSRQIDIAFSDDRLTVEDNCGGISVDEARNEVFLFGNPKEKGAPSGLSVYGIGMKRAFFKLGRRIRVESATQRDWFVIDIDVDEWQQREDDWTFSFTGFGSRDSNTHEPGRTKILITKLRPEVRTRVEQTSFQKDLLTRLGSTYALFLKAGLSIRAKGKEVDTRLPILGTDKDVVPARKSLSHGDVRILIIAGLRPSPAEAASSGWYVFCNGRMVLEADKSEVTGWGDLLPQWHNKYSRFAGYVYFASDDVRLLPWTTTKQAVVYESPVYQTALREMKVQGRPILGFISRLYPGDLIEEDIPERVVLGKIRGVTIDKTPRKQTSFSVTVPQRRPENALISIQYKKRRKDLDRIRQHLGKSSMSASRVGEYTFDHFLKVEVEG